MAKLEVIEAAAVRGPLSANRVTIVGMGEFAVSRNPNVVLSCIGLGSCIGICAYDAVNKVGGLVHVVLPRHDGRDPGNAAKYGDTAVSMLVNEMVSIGAVKSFINVKIVGGAQMSLAAGLNNTFKTGEKNLAEVTAAIDRERLRLTGSDTGGSSGRTVKLHIGTGKVTIRVVGGSDREL